MKKIHIIMMLLVMVGITSCDRPRKEYWRVEINPNCEVFGVKDPGHNYEWIYNDIVEREDGIMVLWPSRYGHEEFYTIWTNNEDAKDQLIALTQREQESQNRWEPWWHWMCFWNCEHEEVYHYDNEDEYNYINSHYTCTDTICVMTCVKRPQKK